MSQNCQPAERQLARGNGNRRPQSHLLRQIARLLSRPETAVYCVSTAAGNAVSGHLPCLPSADRRLFLSSKVFMFLRSKLCSGETFPPLQRLSGKLLPEEAILLLTSPIVISFILRLAVYSIPENIEAYFRRLPSPPSVGSRRKSSLIGSRNLVFVATRNSLLLST